MGMHLQGLDSASVRTRYEMSTTLAVSSRERRRFRVSALHTGVREKVLVPGPHGPHGGILKVGAHHTTAGILCPIDTN